MNTSKKSKNSRINCEGKTIWIRDGKSKQVGATKAIIHSPRKIDVNVEWNKKHCVTYLESNDGITFIADSKKSNLNGHARCKLYSNKIGHLLLGIWVEDSEEYHWVVELKVVELKS